IPNTTVKPSSADGTWTEGSWESRTPPSKAKEHYRSLGSALFVCNLRKTCKSAGIFEKLARFERKPAKVQVFFRIEGNSGVCASKACTFAGILINRRVCYQKTVFLQELFSRYPCFKRKEERALPLIRQCSIKKDYGVNLGAWR
ncbi:MAG: hypothetical protein E7E23_01785, partial [Paenibacillus sp.]|uniref:hypothetical protein n=1 Tax=Paenibacillus sp. TaxID=58172 RepID=UPI00290172C9